MELAAVHRKNLTEREDTTNRLEPRVEDRAEGRLLPGERICNLQVLSDPPLE